jgi:hypothetical protein
MQSQQYFLAFATLSVAFPVVAQSVDPYYRRFQDPPADYTEGLVGK